MPARAQVNIQLFSKCLHSETILGIQILISSKYNDTIITPVCKALQCLNLHKE